MHTLERPAPMTIMHPSTAHATEPFWRAVVRLTSLPIAGVSCGLGLWFSFYPLDQGWVAWFSLVPLLVIARSNSSKWVVYGSASLAGTYFFFPALNWMRAAHPMMLWAWLALTAYCAVYFPLAVALLRRLDRWRLPFALTLPLVWVPLEYLRAHFLTGFGWYSLGYSQHGYLPIIQIADLGGVFAISLLIAAVNGLIFDLLTQRSRRLVAVAAGVGLLFAGSLGYGFWRMSQSDFAAGPRVGVLQSNIAQDIRNERDDDGQRVRTAAAFIIQHTKELTDQIKRSEKKPNLIIWPETTFTEDWLAATIGTPENDLPPWLPEGIKNREMLLADIVHYSDSAVLLGLNTDEFGRGMRHFSFNSALLVGRDAKVSGRYDKIHCVPFGEYVPAKETLPWMQTFSPYDHDYSLTPGERQTRFKLPTSHGEFSFGVLICYEDSDAVLSCRYARETEDGPPVQFLVNMSNDGWFNGTEEHELHMAVCRLRAVEARRAVVRSVNMGISGVIDGNGRVVALPGPNWRESKKIAATFVAEVPIDSRVSLYALTGDWLAVGCCAGCIGLVLATRRRSSVDKSSMAGCASRR